MSRAKAWIHAIRTCNPPVEGEMDTVTKWLVSVRACVFSMTILSGSIGGLLAAVHGSFDWAVFGLVLLGLVAAHAANNLVNDYFDVINQVDTGSYPRLEYAPHPIMSGLITVKKLLWAVALLDLLDLMIALYLVHLRGWTIMLFAVLGIGLSVFYVAPPLKLKHRGLGEAAIFAIWGPLIICGSYYALTGKLEPGVIAASVPYGLAVTAVVIGKHLDKLEKDRERKVGTLPVLLGESKARRLMALLIASLYVFTALAVFAGVLPWPALAVFLSVPRALRIWKILNKPVPETPEQALLEAKDVVPKDLSAQAQGGSFQLWPLWFVAWGVWWVRRAGATMVLGLLISIAMTMD